jgi:hypothetical protein
MREYILIAILLALTGLLGWVQSERRKREARDLQILRESERKPARRVTMFVPSDGGKGGVLTCTHARATQIGDSSHAQCHDCGAVISMRLARHSVWGDERQP